MEPMTEVLIQLVHAEREKKVNSVTDADIADHERSLTAFNAEFKKLRGLLSKIPQRDRRAIQFVLTREMHSLVVCYVNIAADKIMQPKIKAAVKDRDRDALERAIDEFRRLIHD